MRTPWDTVRSLQCEFRHKAPLWSPKTSGDTRIQERMLRTLITGSAQEKLQSMVNSWFTIRTLGLFFKFSHWILFSIPFLLKVCIICFLWLGIEPTALHLVDNHFTYIHPWTTPSVLLFLRQGFPYFPKVAMDSESFYLCMPCNWDFPGNFYDA
jgi:hypothetical protein